MKRKDLITKLVKEGLTEKTLVNMSDRQLGMLAERILGEQYTTYTTATQSPSANSPSILNIPRTDQTSIATAKQQKKTFATYEGEMKEGGKAKEYFYPKDKSQHDKDMGDFKGGKAKEYLYPKDKSQHDKDMRDFEDKKKKHSEVKEGDAKLGVEKKEYTDKDKAIAASNLKIKAAIKDGKDYGDYTRLIKKLCDGKLPESTQKIIGDKKKEVTERKSSTGVNKLAKPSKPAKPVKAVKPAKPSKPSKPVKPIKPINPKTKKPKNLKEWVDEVVEKNIVPFTSKSEIMELINVKLTEQTKPWEDDDSNVDVMDAGQGAPQHAPMPKETEVEPDVKPRRPETEPGVDPDDPFRDPHPGIDPNPKAGSKEHISAREAKDKIIALMKQMLQ